MSENDVYCVFSQIQQEHPNISNANDKLAERITKLHNSHETIT